MTHVEELFEWDEDKSRMVLDKHGIDFYATRYIWADFYLSVPVKQRYLRDGPSGMIARERRWKAIGRIQGEVWTAIYTKRNGRIRLITCRPANDNERSEYDRKFNMR